MSGMNNIGRRRFTALMAATLLPSSPVAGRTRDRQLHPSRPMTHLIKPPRLQKGDLVGLIAPGGYTSDAAIQRP